MAALRNDYRTAKFANRIYVLEEKMLRIKDIMTTNVFAVPETQTLDLARSLMKIEEIRHVPVVNDKNEFVGLVTHKDLLTQMIAFLTDFCESSPEELDTTIPISSIMTSEVITVAPDLPVADALPILLDHKFGCLPVVADKLLVGIVTNADFLKLTHEILKSEGVDFSRQGSGLSAECTQTP